MTKIMAAPFIAFVLILGLLLGYESGPSQDAKLSVQSANNFEVLKKSGSSDTSLAEVQERKDALRAEASRDEERQLIKYKERRAEARAEAKAARKADRKAERVAARVAARQAARAAEAQAVTEAPTSNNSGGSSNLPELLLTIRSNESGGNYQAYNPSGCEGYGCGGAYQLHAKYAAGWAAEAGYGGMSSQAQNWPVHIQDAVALYKFNATGGDLWCNWTDYC